GTRAAQRAADIVDGRARELLTGLRAVAPNEQLVRWMRSGDPEAGVSRPLSDDVLDPLQRQLRDFRLALGTDVRQLAALDLLGVVRGVSPADPALLGTSHPASAVTLFSEVTARMRNYGE